MGPSIYLGVQGYGCIRAEDKDRFAHRFRQDDSVCCYAVCNKGRYAIQNRLQEGQAYHLTIRQETVTQAVLSPSGCTRRNQCRQRQFHHGRRHAPSLPRCV